MGKTFKSRSLLRRPGRNRDKSSLAPGGKPPYNDGMEARVAVLEQIARNTETTLARMDARMMRIEDRMMRVEDIQRTDFRLLFGSIIATALGLAGVMAKGFHWL